MIKKLTDYFYTILIIQFVSAILIIAAVLILKTAKAPIYNDFGDFCEQRLQVDTDLNFVLSPKNEEFGEYAVIVDED